MLQLRENSTDYPNTVISDSKILLSVLKNIKHCSKKKLNALRPNNCDNKCRCKIARRIIIIIIIIIIIWWETIHHHTAKMHGIRSASMMLF